MPEPLHPAVVHLPIALALLVPLGCVVALVTIQRGWMPARVWWAVLGLQALLGASGYAALETGEWEEERVEKVVAERHIEEHEEAAERFLVLAGVAFLVMGTGLLPDRAGRIGRAVGTLASLGVLAASVQVGHLGGELVYRHGAASAYVETGSTDASRQDDEHRDH